MAHSWIEQIFVPTRRALRYGGTLYRSLSSVQRYCGLHRLILECVARGFGYRIESRRFWIIIPSP
jgi:hypothetical protein